MNVDHDSKYVVNTFIPFYLFPSLNLKHPEGRNSVILHYLPNIWHFTVLEKYLLNKGMTIHRFQNTEDQPMDGYPLNQRMLRLNGGLNIMGVTLCIRRESELFAATDQVSVADAGLKPGP